MKAQTWELSQENEVLIKENKELEDNHLKDKNTIQALNTLQTTYILPFMADTILESHETMQIDVNKLQMVVHNFDSDLRKLNDQYNEPIKKEFLYKCFLHKPSELNDSHRILDEAREQHKQTDNKEKKPIYCLLL